MNKDKTGNERQDRRREREKKWLQEHGYVSWEALHTVLTSGVIEIPHKRSNPVDKRNIVVKSKRKETPSNGRTNKSNPIKTKRSKPGSV